jgi:hypothetical protein
MPLYNTSTTAAAIGVSAKWLDNLLSHNKVEGVQSERQGVARRLAFPAVATVALAHEIVTSSSIPVAAALRIAGELLASTDGVARLTPSLTLALDAPAFRAELLERLAQAVEDAPRPVRGRPRKQPAVLPAKR